MREERKLWGRELAQQGAALAQDRGRMEAQVEALTQEVRGLQDRLQQERETVRIKGKVVEDQERSIQELRQGVATREYELQSARLEWQQQQKMLQLQVEQEEAASQDLQVRQDEFFALSRFFYTDDLGMCMFVCVDIVGSLRSNCLCWLSAKIS